jgi:hypothetical protein
MTGYRPSGDRRRWFGGKPTAPHTHLRSVLEMKPPPKSGADLQHLIARAPVLPALPRSADARVPVRHQRKGPLEAGLLFAWNLLFPATAPACNPEGDAKEC